MTSGERDGLVPTEGVDEGSAASTAEGSETDEGGGDLLGAAPVGGPASETDPAGPEQVETADITEARRNAPGQELAEGEG